MNGERGKRGWVEAREGRGEKSGRRKGVGEGREGVVSRGREERGMRRSD